jgi:hypothetical protein
MLYYDHQARLQLSREHAAALARDYERARKLDSRSPGASEERDKGLGRRLARRRRRAASAQA